MEIFKLFGSIFVDNEAANKSISATDQKAEGLGTKLQKGAVTAAKWGAAIGAGAAAAGTALFAVASKSAQTTDRIDKMSQKIGLSREGFQEWDFILSQSGTSVESLQMGFKSMVSQVDQAVKGTGKGAEAFKSLGISVKDANGNIKDQEALFNETVIALQNMEDGTEKARLANQLLGRSGSELMPLLNGAAGSVEEMRQQARDLGLVLSDDAIDAGVQFTDTMDQLKRSFGAVMTQVGAGVIPIFQTLAQWVIDHMPQIRAVFQAVFDVLQPIVAGFIDVIRSLIEWLGKWAADNQDKLERVREIFGRVFEAIGSLIGAFVDLAMAFWDLFGEHIINAVMWVWDLIAGTIEGALNIIIGIFDFFSALFRGDWEGVWNAVKDIAAAIWNMITGLFEKLWDGLLAIVSGAWNLLKSGFGKLWDGIKGWFSDLWENFKNWGRNLIQGLWEGIKERWERLKSTVSGFFSGIGDMVKGVFGISSPSKLFAGIGQDIMAGLQVGLESMTPEVDATMTSVAGGMESAIAGAAPGVGASAVAVPGIGGIGPITISIYGSVGVEDIAERLVTEIRRRTPLR